MLDQLWLKFRPQIEERAAVLGRAAAELAEGNLSSDLRADAQAAAHKLAGSLGTFGLTTGGELAREAEGLLSGESPLDAADSERIIGISSELHSIILSGRTG